MTSQDMKPKNQMTNTLCLRCLTAGRRTPVPLTADAYRCPVCGFAAQVQRVNLQDVLWGVVDVTPGPVWWSGGEAHSLER